MGPTDVSFAIDMLRILSFLAAYATKSFDYCGIQTCSNHTMCDYPTAAAGPECPTLLSTGLTYQEQREIVDRHNAYRERIKNGNEWRGDPGPQPPAKYMPPLEWDPELAMIAQRWANQCSAKNDKCRDVERFEVGQTVAAFGTYHSLEFKFSLGKIVDAWYSNVRKFDKDKVSGLTDFTGVSAYTQIVWANTTYIGCGKIVFQEERDGTTWNRVNVVCNYGPRGNNPGEPVYEVAD